MWRTKPLLLVLAVSLVVNQTSSADLDLLDCFDILDSGGCGNRQETLLETFFSDAKILKESLVDALICAETRTTLGGDLGQEGVVARKLFTAYFGIQFQDKDDGSKEQTPTADYTDHWTQINYAFSLVDEFLEDGTLAAPGNDKPWIACTGSIWGKMDWGDEAFTYDPKTESQTSVVINGRTMTIGDLYGKEDGKTPYFLKEKTMYEIYDDDDVICDADSLATSFPGSSESQKTIQGVEVQYADIGPGVMLCPNVFDDQPSKLGDVKWVDPNTKKELTEVMPVGSSTLFHELFHLVTFQSKPTKEGLQRSIDDITYDEKEILQLARGEFEEEVDGETKKYTSYDSTLNAATYEYFTFAWWYYKNIRSSTVDGVTTPQTPATFYHEFLTNAV